MHFIFYKNEEQRKKKIKRRFTFRMVFRIFCLKHLIHIRRSLLDFWPDTRFWWIHQHRPSLDTLFGSGWILMCRPAFQILWAFDLNSTWFHLNRKTRHRLYVYHMQTNTASTVTTQLNRASLGSGKISITNLSFFIVE